MFSEAYYSEVKQHFADQMLLLKGRVEELERKEAEMAGTDRKLCHAARMLLEQKKEEISSTVAGCTQDEAEAMQFLYSAMPLSDLLNYPVTVYLAYARHGVFLWKEGPFAGKVPEKIFANYVLHHRVHSEDIVDTRKFFYDRLRERTVGKSMYEAAVETNYWCAEKATYQTTFMRTQNPLTMYGTAIGRCGEEAPFVATALRSIGIPAREVSAPWWAHCDDNHAWVEAWCDGEWHFLGGCEPERTLDKGWFNGPASRAMMIESRWFGKDAPEEPVVGRPDMSAMVNHLDRYAKTARLVVKVTDGEGKLVPGARVDFAVLNFARFNSMAALYTGTVEGSQNYGKVRIDTGYGDFLVCAHADGCYGERHISLAEVLKERKTKPGCNVAKLGCDEAKSGHNEAKPGYNTATTRCMEALDGEMKDGTLREGFKVEYTVVIRKKMQQLDQWRELDFHAPKGVLQDERKTEEEAAAEKADLEVAARSRQQRVDNFYRKEDAERVLARFSGEDREDVDEMLHQARGNMGEIVRFLEWDFSGKVMELEEKYGQKHWKVEVLKVLKPNDYWDIKAEILAECSICASPYTGMFPREVFFFDLLNPCAMFEIPRACRDVLADILSEDEKAEIRENPKCLPEKLDSFLISMPEQEYANLITGSVGCLTGGIGNEISRVILCIQIYRALGIPARMRPMERTMEYYADGVFIPIPIASKEGGQKGVLVLEGGESLRLEDWKHYSLSRFEKGRFMPLFIRPERKKPGAGRIQKSEPGEEPKEKPGEEPKAKTGEELKEKLGEELKEKPGEELKEKTREELKEKTGEVLKEKLGEELKEKPREKPKEKAGEELKKKPEEEPDGIVHKGQERRLELESGIYRIVTTNRLPNGNQLVKVQDFELTKGEEKRIVLQMRKIPQEALLSRVPVEDFALHTKEGEEVMFSSLSEGKKALILWLELSKEPTEHILNEMCEKYELFEKLAVPIYFVIRNSEDCTRDQTLLKACSVLPGAKLLFDDFGESYGNLSFQVGRDAGKLPLAMVMEDGKECIFSDCGYNVGMADMLLRILE